MSKDTQQLIPAEAIQCRILVIRGQKVMLDRDLALLYGVKPIALRQQVKRNPERFPEDFMFRLSKEEMGILLSQNVIPSRSSLGGFLPMAFTEQGVAMLSSVLKSKRAVSVNIAIMRAFVRLRGLLDTHKDLAQKLEDMDRKYDTQFKVVFDILDEWMRPPLETRQIGFVPTKKFK